MPPQTPLSRTCIALAVGQVISLAAAMPANAGTIAVDNTGDGSGATCTLRQAINSANSANGLSFSTGNTGNCSGATNGANTINLTNNQIITLSQTETPYNALQINSDITINGNNSTVSSNGGDFRLINVPDSTSGSFGLVNGILTLNEVTVTGASLSSAVSLGGAINVAGTLTLNNSTVSSSTAAGGGGIYSSGELNIHNSTITGNSATNATNTFGGGGIMVRGATSSLVVDQGSEITMNRTERHGGGVFLADTDNSIIDNVVLSGNVSDYGGGIYTRFSDYLSVTSSALSTNTASGRGGAIYAFQSDNLGITNSVLSGNAAATRGGGIRSSSSDSMSLVNSTMSGNNTTSGSSSGGGLSFFNNDHFSMVNSTLTANSAYFGGGMSVFESDYLSIVNSLISGNPATYQGDEVYFGSVVTTTLSGNLFGDSSTAKGVGLVGIDPAAATNKLAFNDELSIPLATILNTNLVDNGGPTLTHALVSGSPAIGSANTEDCPATDQRGQGRDTSDSFFTIKTNNDNVVVINLSGDCDIGAVEFSSGD